MELTFKKCVPEDVCTLRDFSRKMYYNTFSSMNTPSNMIAYLEQAYNIERLRDELTDDASSFYFLYTDSELAGYIKINEALSQTDINDAWSLEIEKIYVAKEFQGKGLGHVLMNKAVDMAKERKKTYIWLGVWEKNDKAIAFYEKNGFYKISSHPFIMGDETQTDYIMRMDLPD